MTTLPATLAEAEATQFARGWVTRLSLIDDSPWRPGAGEAFARQILRTLLSDPNGLQDVINLARSGWCCAIDAVDDYMVEHAANGEPLVGFVAAYAADRVKGYIKPVRDSGQARTEDLARNHGIAMTVAALIDRFGLKPTGRSARRRSACAIVAEALQAIGMQLGYKAVEAIWNTYRRAMPTVPGWAR
jgi:hypothetical protein